MRRLAIALSSSVAVLLMVAGGWDSGARADTPPVQVTGCFNSEDGAGDTNAEINFNQVTHSTPTPGPYACGQTQTLSPATIDFTAPCDNTGKTTCSAHASASASGSTSTSAPPEGPAVFSASAHGVADASVGGSASDLFADSEQSAGGSVRFVVNTTTGFDIEASTDKSGQNSSQSSVGVVLNGPSGQVFNLTSGSGGQSGTLAPGTYGLSTFVDARADANFNSSDPTAATAHSQVDATATLTLTPNTCQPGQLSSVKVGFALAAGCFTETAKGSKIFETDQDAYVGGFLLRPQSGAKLQLRLDQNPARLEASGGSVDLVAGGTAVPFPVEILPVGFAQAELNFGGTGTTAGALGGAILKGLGYKNFPVSTSLKVVWGSGGASATVSGSVDVQALVKSAGTVTDFPSGLPVSSGSGPSGPGGPSFGGVSGTFSLNATNGSGFQVQSLSVKVSKLGLLVPPGSQLVGIDAFSLSETILNGQQILAGETRISIPRAAEGSGGPAPKPLVIGARLRFVDGDFAGAGLTVDGVNKPLGDTGIFFQGLSGDLVTHPDPGFSVGGNFTLLPELNDEAIAEGTLELKGFGLASDCTTSTFPLEIHAVITSSVLENHGIGKLGLEGVRCLYFGSPVAEDSESGDLRIDVAGVKGVMGFKAQIKGWIGLGAMDLEGTGKISLPVAPDLSGTALLSSVGYAGCASFGWFQGGFGATWFGLAPAQTFTGCDLGPWRPPVPVAGDASARAVAARAVVRSALPLEGFMARGTDGPPRVALVGPGGIRFVAPADGHLVKTNNVVIGTSLPERAVFFIVRRPARGAWRIVNLDSAHRATSVSVADGLPNASIHASVRRHGARFQLRYAVPRGVRVQFVESAGGLQQPIGKPRSAGRGTIGFKPLVVGSSRHLIEAIVVASGLPRPGKVLARFKVHAPLRPGPVRKLKVTRTNGQLRIRFVAPRAAASYLIVLTDNAGHLMRAVTTRPASTITGVPSGPLTLQITARSALGRPGPTVTRRIK